MVYHDRNCCGQRQFKLVKWHNPSCCDFWIGVDIEEFPHNCFGAVSLRWPLEVVDGFPQTVGFGHCSRSVYVSVIISFCQKPNLEHLAYWASNFQLPITRCSTFPFLRSHPVIQYYLLWISHNIELSLAVLEFCLSVANHRNGKATCHEATLVKIHHINHGVACLSSSP